MTDSIDIFFGLSREDRQRLHELKLPYRKHMGGWNDAEQADNCWLPAIVDESVLTAAGFKIQPIGFVTADASSIGYLVRINIPACTVGNNTLLGNSVLAASKIALHLLQYWLLKRGSDRETIDCFNIADSELWSVTPTFFIDCANKEEALSLLSAFRVQSEAIHNRHQAKGGVHARATAYGAGSTTTGTRYIRLRDHQVSGYVKLPDGRKAFFKASAEVAERLFSSAACKLRLEVKLSKAWLARHGLQHPLDWLRGGKRDPYQEAYRLILRAVNAETPLQNRVPSEDQLSTLNADYRSVLNWYLAGNEARQHPIFQAQGTPQKQSQKFSTYRKRIREVARIDIGIDWKTHKKVISPRLCDALLTKRVEPDSALEDLVFSRKTATAAIEKLKKLIENFEEVRRTLDEAWHGSGDSAPMETEPDDLVQSPCRPGYGRGIGGVPVPESIPPDELIFAYGEWRVI